MQRVKFSYEMRLQFSQPIQRHVFSLLSFPLRLPEQQIYGFSWSLSPSAVLTVQQDCFGNQIGAGRYEEPHQIFQYQMQGMAWLDPSRRRPEPCFAAYRYPSCYCSATPSLLTFLRQCAIPKQATALQRAGWLMNHLYQQFRYQTGSTSVFTTAGQAFDQGYGVCQDYAHIFITLCRASGIAARYVAGMIDGQGETHAWVEVYDQGLWHGFDPTQNKPAGQGYLKLAQGRDYQDCRLNRGVFCGTATQQQFVSINLEELV